MTVDAGAPEETVWGLRLHRTAGWYEDAQPV